MRRYIYEILTGTTGTTNQLPIFLEASVDEMGIMVGFDGEIEQINQYCNFTYAGGVALNSIVVYNTVNTNNLRTLIDSVFTVSWGDGTYDNISMPTVYDENLPYASHLYSSSGIYNIVVSVNSPWKVENINKNVYIPITGSTLPTDLGTLTFTIPYSVPTVTQTQDYLEDYRTLTGNTSATDIQFLAIGKSRLDELRNYGGSYTYSGITTGTNGGGNYTGYTIDGLYYMDYDDGYTQITGNTGDFYSEEVYQGMITRNEHLIGFLDEPQIYSDIFVDRGKQGVMERNLRLGEIDSTGELDIYGGGFFNVKKQ
jgi:hypothetical protein